MERGGWTRQVLIVEDEPFVRGLVVRVIEEAGFEALPAGSVPEALALVEDHDPDAAILDIELGPGHGTAVAGLAVGDVIGVATGADWIAGIACSEGGCPLSGVVHAMQFMLAPTTLDEQDPRPDLRPQIINSSWVRSADDEPMKRASEALAASGILQVYAAGNDGPECETASPAGEGDSCATQHCRWVISSAALRPTPSTAYPMTPPDGDSWRRPWRWTRREPGRARPPDRSSPGQAAHP